MRQLKHTRPQLACLGLDGLWTPGALSSKPADSAATFQNYLHEDAAALHHIPAKSLHTKEFIFLP
jgi:hypothetical protein